MVDLMNPTVDVIVQQLLFMVVQGGVHILVPQPCILPDLLQRVLLQQAAILKNSHQQVLKNAEHTQTHTEVNDKTIKHIQVLSNLKGQN